MEKILIVGAGGHAQVIADLINCLSHAGEKIKIAGFIDDDPPLWGTANIFGKVLGPVSKIKDIPHDHLILAIGNNQIRQAKYSQLRASGETFMTLVHPRATIASDVKLGAGSVVFASAVINTGSVIGENVIVNTGSTIDHHNRIGSHSHIAPGSHLGGGVSIGEGAFLGIGSIVIPGKTIDAYSIIGAGSVVVDNIPSYVTAYGIPAKVKPSNLS